MKAIDERKNERKDKFKVGDVFCYYDDGDSKKYYAIVVSIRTRYALIDLNGDSCGESSTYTDNDYPSITQATADMYSQWDHVEKVNTQLVIVD